MRKLKKKEILDIVNTIQDVNDSVVKRKYTDNELMDLLSESQTLIMNLVNYFEENKEITEKMIEELIECYKNIYEMYIFLEDKKKCNKLHKKIRNELLLVKKYIWEDLPNDKKEIVFFTYKASMWDSFASIWKAAKEDKECNVYVVPIPYYDKNPDGTIREIHYEAEEYPKYVNITSWKEYIVEEKKPDIIYIHNPYDNSNYVTSVHPRFYARELKKYTDMLVYVPYFVAINNRVEKHLCTVPGVRYANRVIVQSQQVRKIYIDTINEFEKVNGCKGIFGNVKEKIVALGSPKYDSLYKRSLEDNQLPIEWLKLIVEPNGNKKKVILYNTTIAGILMYEEQELKKIKEVLDEFKQHKDIVLWWRPHPLIKATLQSMRPKLLQSYIEIEEQYKKEGWGIYDESSELHRAIVYTDAYYGDKSSVIDIYAKTGKPVLMQRITDGNDAQNE